MAIGEQVFTTGAGLLRCFEVWIDGSQNCLNPAVLKLIATGLAPLFALFSHQTEEVFGELREGALGMIHIDDLNGVGIQFIGDIPDPAGSVADDDSTLGAVKSPSSRLALNPSGELAELLI